MPTAVTAARAGQRRFEWFDDRVRGTPAVLPLAWAGGTLPSAMQGFRRESGDGIQGEVTIEVPPEQVWSALRDVGALHSRLVAGFVTDCRLEGDARVVTFANGLVAKELIVDVDDAERRVAWAAVGGRLTHHNASAQVFAQGPAGSRVVWIADLLPNELAPAIATMIDQGLAAMKKTLERAANEA